MSPANPMRSPSVVTRFSHSVCRYEQEDVICRVFGLMGFPPPPPGLARRCAEEVFKVGGTLDALAGETPQGADLIGRRAKISDLLTLLDAPKIEPTRDQVRDPTLLGRTLFVMSAASRVGVEIHAGVGAIFYRKDGDTLVSEVAPITGTGMDMRRDYLLSVIEATRDTLEQTFS